MIKTILAVPILLISLMSFGQVSETYSKQWSLEIGYQNFRTFDKNVSPLIYSANNGVIGFEYLRKKSDKKWNIKASVSIGSNQSKRFGRREAIAYDDFTINGARDSTVYDINPIISFLQGSISYSYYKKLNNTNMEMHVGGQVVDNFYYGALGADVWFFNQLSIMPAYQIEVFEDSKSSINAGISIPILSYLIRQPYTLDPSLPEESYFKAYLQTGSSVNSLNDFQQINSTIGYRYTLEKGTQVGLTYNFSWMNYSNIPERNLKTYSNTLLITYTF